MDLEKLIICFYRNNSINSITILVRHVLVCLRNGWLDGRKNTVFAINVAEESLSTLYFAQVGPLKQKQTRILALLRYRENLTFHHILC